MSRRVEGPGHGPWDSPWSNLASHQLEPNHFLHVHHFEFTAWPLKGLPDTAAVMIVLNAVHNLTKKSKVPTLIHDEVGGAGAAILAVVENMVYSVEVSGSAARRV